MTVTLAALDLDKPRILSRLALAHMEVTASVPDADYERMREQQRVISTLEVKAEREYRTGAMESWVITRRRLRMHRTILAEMMMAVQDGRSLDNINTAPRLPTEGVQ